MPETHETSGDVAVLMVDDEPAGLVTLEAVLEGLGAELVKAGSGREALRLLLDRDFAVILLDVNMPGIGGFETAELLRGRERTRRTPIIFLTAALEDEQQTARAYTLGAVDFMRKPIVPEILRSKVLVFVELARSLALIQAQAEELGRKNEELDRQRAVAQQESRFKSRFLANMSHELRTPLNAIIGFSDLLGEETFGPLGPKQKEYVAYIQQSGRHLVGLVNDILDLSRLEADRMVLTREWTAAVEAIQSVLSVVRPLSTQKGVTLACTPPADLPEVYADPVRLKQILYNLVSNGIKFTPRGGRVDITAEAADGDLVIVVRDTGIGIRPEDMSRLFREFERIEPASGPTQEGTGLGLVISRRFAELHGGTLTAESDLGRGSTFTLRLPLRRGSREGSAASPVLVVEDNPLDAELIATYLRGAGIAFVHARDADEATRLAGELRPVAITLDIQLPGSDGWDVLQRLRSAPVTSGVPIIVLSVVDDARRSMLLGADDFLLKPVGREALLRSLSRAGSPPAPPAAK